MSHGYGVSWNVYCFVPVPSMSDSIGMLAYSIDFISAMNLCSAILNAKLMNSEFALGIQAGFASISEARETVVFLPNYTIRIYNYCFALCYCLFSSVICIVNETLPVNQLVALVD